MSRWLSVCLLLVLAGCERQPETTVMPAPPAADAAGQAAPAEPLVVPVTVKRQVARESVRLGLPVQAIQLEVKPASCRRRCTSYRVDWLYFPGQPALNQLLLSGEPGAPAALPADAQGLADTLQRMGSLFVQDAQESSMPWDASLTLGIWPGVGEVRVLKREQWAFTGGAHGSSQHSYFNWHAPSGRVLTLEDLLLPEQSLAFWHEVEQVYDDWLRSKDNPEVFIESWPFQQTGNVALLADHLRLQYQAYELGPYSEGMPSFDIPYARLRGVLRPEFLPE